MRLRARQKRVRPSSAASTRWQPGAGAPRATPQSAMHVQPGRRQRTPVEKGLDEEDLLGLNLNISSLSLGTTERLVDHDAGVGQGFPLAGSARAEEESTHGGSGAEANSGHVARDVLHGIVDGHTGRHGAAGRVDCVRTATTCQQPVSPRQKHGETGALHADGHFCWPFPSQQKSPRQAPLPRLIHIIMTHALPKRAKHSPTPPGPSAGGQHGQVPRGCGVAAGTVGEGQGTHCTW
jgi:hypothetical protein